MKSLHGNKGSSGCHAELMDAFGISYGAAVGSFETRPDSFQAFAKSPWGHSRNWGLSIIDAGPLP